MFLNEVMYLSQNAASPIFFVDCFPIRRNVVFVYLLFASHHKHCFQIHYAAPKATMECLAACVEQVYLAQVQDNAGN